MGDAAESAPEDAGIEPEELDLGWDTPTYGHAGTAAGDPDVEALEDGVREFLDSIETGDYVGLQVYLAGGDEDELEALQRLREAITATTGAATTLAYGPRFLHSTGQLHKGGPDSGAYLQIVDDAAAHVHVPETDFTFHQLIRAQADGDLAALRERGRRALRVRVGSPVEGIERLTLLIDRTRAAGS